MASRSRDSISPEFYNFVCASSNRGRRESRMRAAPAVSCAKNACFGAHEHTGEAEAIRPSLRNGLTTYTCSPWRPCCATIACGPYRKLDASVGASGPHAFVVRCLPLVHAQKRVAATPRPPHPAPNVSWTIMIRPSSEHGTAGIIHVIWEKSITISEIRKIGEFAA
jgi:hypothetical protein